MKIISYRGPSCAGGLSTAVGQAWREYSDDSDLWCHLQKNELQVLSHDQENRPIINLSEEIVDGHYRYCNEFLWPLMHDLEEYAVYNAEHNRQYEQLNATIVDSLERSSLSSSYFIHDYHFGLSPRLLRQRSESRSTIFWHIPWPETIINWS